MVACLRGRGHCTYSPAGGMGEVAGLTVKRGVGQVRQVSSRGPPLWHSRGRGGGGDMFLAITVLLVADVELMRHAVRELSQHAASARHRSAGLFVLPVHNLMRTGRTNNPLGGEAGGRRGGGRSMASRSRASSSSPNQSPVGGQVYFAAAAADNAIHHAPLLLTTPLSLQTFH